MGRLHFGGLAGLSFHLIVLLLLFRAGPAHAADLRTAISALSWKQETLAAILAGGTNKLVLQESADLQHWVETASIRSGSSLQTPSRYSRRFFRVAAVPALPPPQPIPEDDIFYPFLRTIPPAVEILSEQVVDGVNVRELRFAWYEGTEAGGISTNAIFAIMASPLAASAAKLPAILSCHGGFQYPVQSVLVEWAKRGFVAIAPELPGIVNPVMRRSISRVAGKRYNEDLIKTTPNVRAGTIFDCILAGLGAFNLLGSRSDVNTNAMYIEGASFGGYTTLVLAGLLDTRVARVFSLYGSGFHLIDTLLTVPLLGKTPEEQKAWVDALDVSARIDRVRATVLMFAASNDSFFRPPSVNATFDAIPSEKYLCYSPNENHTFTLPGGKPPPPAMTWTTIEPEFFLDSTNRFPTALPKISKGEWQDRTLMLDISALPAGATVWAYCSAPPYRGWDACEWIKLRISQENGRYRLFFPEHLASCFWFAGLFFNFRLGNAQSTMSLSTPAYFTDLPRL